MRKALGEAVLKAAGWTLATGAPDAQKLVIIAAPHTSNWDFVLAMSALSAMDVPVAWMGKNSLFRGPAGALFRKLGGIAVDRSRQGRLVDAMVHEFEGRDRFALLVPAEGTRSAGERWKSGFYHIARGAKVPIGLGFLDYATKRAGIGPLVWPSGDVRHDMEQIRTFYADKRGKHPEDFTPPYLREEGTRDKAPRSSARLRPV